MKNNNGSGGGLDLVEVVQIIFIILKLFNLIQISWWKVFMPTYFYAAFALALILIFRLFK